MASTDFKPKSARKSKKSAMASNPVESYRDKMLTLNSGTQMPAVGMGTYRIHKEDDVMRAVEHALDNGYRLFDIYNNESRFKKAFQTLLPKYGLDREDIFVTTKFALSQHGGLNVVNKAYQKCLDNLGFDHVDLYLIHSPKTIGLHALDHRNRQYRELAWESLQELYDDGRVDAIGVSNFSCTHLEEIVQNNSIIPAVNQLEWHPFYYQPDVLSYCKQNDIVVQAYCSFGGASISNTDLLEHKVVKEIAKKLDVSCAQVLLVWALQQDIGVIPKSVNPERIKENITLSFRIPDEDMKLLNALGMRNTRYAWHHENVY